MSQMGSADDMSIAGIVDMDAGESAMRWMELTYILSNHKAAQRNAAGKAGSMARKQDYLKEELDRAQQEFDRVQTEYNRVCQQMQQNLTLTERLKQELRKLLHAQDNQTVILEAAGKKLEKAREDYEDYVEKRLGFVEKAQEAEAEVLRTQQAIDALAAELFDQVPEQTQPEIPDWELAEPIAWEDEEPFSQEENEQEKLQPEEAPMPETEPEAADDFD
jgi:DNA repair exonuclease SbcCD ATPase subunit